jgi:hypothetical protein
VCKERKCFSSVEKLSNEIIKMNERLLNMEELNEELAKVWHNSNHLSLTDADLIGENFCFCSSI